jgi:hypothetical protein
LFRAVRPVAPLIFFAVALTRADDFLAAAAAKGERRGTVLVASGDRDACRPGGTTATGMAAYSVHCRGIISLPEARCYDRDW